MVIRDSEVGRVIQYTSGTEEKGLFDLECAKEVLEQAEGSTKWYNHLTNDDYVKFLKCSKFLDEDTRVLDDNSSSNQAKSVAQKNEVSEIDSSLHKARKTC